MKVFWVSYDPEVPARGVYWDMSLLEDILVGCEHAYEITKEGKAIVVFPARRQSQFVERLNKDIQKIKSLKLIIIGDEEFVFDFRSLSHPDMELWVQSALPSMVGVKPFPLGYAAKCRESLKAVGYQVPNQDVFFAGQITHDRRRQCIDNIKEMKGQFQVNYLETAGFTQGMEPARYFTEMAFSKVMPCPSGPQIPDTFRVYEALEAGRIPVADDLSPGTGDLEGFWDNMFPGSPVPVIRDFDSLPGYTNEFLSRYGSMRNDLYAWWQKYKMDLRKHFNPIDSDVTVVIPTSLIKTHPDTGIIEETIKSIRHYFPESEIIITCEGRGYGDPDYEEYKARLLWKCNFKWHNVIPVVFNKFSQQSNMLKAVMGDIKTPLILYVEHDAPMVTDRNIDWNLIKDALYSGDADLVRLLHEEQIHPEHEHLVFRREGHFVKTKQWSQRPHLATKSFYARILQNYFTDDPEFIEDVMHGVVATFCKDNPNTGWYNFRICIYNPTEDPIGIKRSYHLDGRKTK